MAENITVGGQILTVSDFKKLKPIKNDELVRAVASKLIHDPNRSSTNNGVKSIFTEGIKDDTARNIASITASNIEDVSYIFQLLPEVETAMDIWVSCILNPKDGITESLIWSIDDTNTDYNSSLFNDMLNVVKKYFEEEYNLIDIVKPAIEDALFKTGSYPLIVIPESAIDDIINGKMAMSNESIINDYYVKQNNTYVSKSVGLLGNPKAYPSKANGNIKQIGIESYIINATNVQNASMNLIHPHLSVTDSVDILKVRLALESNTKRNIKDRLRKHYGLEQLSEIHITQEDILNVTTNRLPEHSPIAKSPAVKQYTGDEVLSYSRNTKKSTNVEEPTDNNVPASEEPTQDKNKNIIDTKTQNSIVNALYEDRAYTRQPVVNVSGNRARQPIGKPLVMKIPSAAVIPVHVPGNYRDIVGAFILLDEFGNPLDLNNETDLYNDIKETATRDNITGAVGMIKSLGGNCDRKDDMNNKEYFKELSRVYGSLIETDLINRLSTGLYGRDIKLAHVDEVYRIMLARALSAMNTQILFCPGDFLTYFCFDFNKYGIGKTVLDDSKDLAAQLAALDKAKMFQEIQNAIGRRKLSITVDETDPDPMKTVNILKNEYVKANSWMLPLLSSGSVDTVNTLREASIDLVIQGENPGIPNTSIDVEDVTVSRPVIDDNIRNGAKNRFIAKTGVPTTLVDETNAAEYSIQARNSHQLFARRVVTNQKIVSQDLLYDHVCKVTLNHGGLIKRLSLIIKDNLDKLTDEQRNQGNTIPIIENFLKCLSVELPTADLTKLEEQNNDLDKYTQLVDKVIDGILPNSVLTSILSDELSSKAELVKDVMKSSLYWKYINDNNYTPSLLKLLDKDNVEDTISSLLESTYNPIAGYANDAIITFDQIRKKNADAKANNAAQDMNEGDDSFGGSSDSSSSDTGGDDFGSDIGGGDDFDF